MTRSSWVYVDGVAIPKDQYHETSSLASGPTIMRDTIELVSPVDGSYIRGRRAFHDHNIRNNVTPMADLQGLPTLTSNSDLRSSEQKRELADSRKRAIIDGVNRHYR